MNEINSLEQVASSACNAVSDKPFKKIKDLAIGVGLRSSHYQQVLAQKPAIQWFEIHSENFFTPGTHQRIMLDELKEIYPLSFHGIGLSLGSTDPLNMQHLSLLKALVDEYNPALISEHLSWNSFGNRYFNDLLPIPYTQECLLLFCDRLNQVQDFLGRSLLIENPTTYLAFSDSTMNEWEFLNEIQQRCQCGLLLDLNNIYVNSVNLKRDTTQYLQNINVDAVKEIHLAGFTRKVLDNSEILIDTHGSPVSEPVWAMFELFRRQCKAPALIEWDTDVPELSVLMNEAAKAESIQAKALL